MCVVSMIMDHHREKWEPRLPRVDPWVPFVPVDPFTPTAPPTIFPPQPHPVHITDSTPRISKEEIEEFRILLERAREYDRKHHQPDCELDAKRKALKDLARQLGVEIAFL